MASSASNPRLTLITLEYRISVDIMRQHKFCQDKQQYNNAKPFPVNVATTEVIENVPI